jgi:hypothetical protein
METKSSAAGKSHSASRAVSAAMDRPPCGLARMAILRSARAWTVACALLSNVMALMCDSSVVPKTGDIGQRAKLESSSPDGPKDGLLAHVCDSLLAGSAISTSGDLARMAAMTSLCVIDPAKDVGPVMEKLPSTYVAYQRAP